MPKDDGVPEVYDTARVDVRTNVSSIVISVTFHKEWREGGNMMGRSSTIRLKIYDDGRVAPGLLSGLVPHLEDASLVSGPVLQPPNDLPKKDGPGTTKVISGGKQNPPRQDPDEWPHPPEDPEDERTLLPPPPDLYRSDEPDAAV